MVDRYEALERFSKLRDAGVLSEEEFAAEKARLLGGEPAAPDYATMPSAAVSPSAERSRWPLRLVLTALVVAAILVMAMLLSTRPSHTAPTPVADTAARALPTCDSSDARDLLTHALAATGSKLTDVTRAAQTGFDAAAQVRTCAADLTLTGAKVAHRTFRLLSGEDGGFRVELVANAAPTGSPPAGAATTPGNSADDETDGEIASDDAAYYRHQAALAAPKPITVFDPDQGVLCCVTLGDVVRYFSTRGGSATIDPSDDGSGVIYVKDPAGRWKGLTGFELNFAASGPDKLGVRLVSLSVNDQPLENVDLVALLRASFHLRPTQPDSDAGGEQ